MTKNSLTKQNARAAASASGRSYTHERRRLIAPTVNLSEAALHVAGVEGQEVDSDDRLIRITGAVGSGKTVLAYLLAKDWADRTGAVVVVDRTEAPSRWAYRDGWTAIGATIVAEFPEHAAPNTMYVIESENFTEPDDNQPLKASLTLAANLLRSAEDSPSSRFVVTAASSMWAPPQPATGAWLGLRLWDGAPDGPARHFVQLTAGDSPDATLTVPRRYASDETMRRLQWPNGRPVSPLM